MSRIFVKYEVFNPLDPENDEQVNAVASIEFAEMSRPTVYKNWGWCNEYCDRDERGGSNISPGVLKEAKLDVLTPKQCLDMAFEESPHVENVKELRKQCVFCDNLEFCAGKKVRYPRVKKYRMNYDRRNKRFWYEQRGQKTNYLGKRGRTYNFFVGGEAECQGNVDIYP